MTAENRIFDLVVGGGGTNGPAIALTAALSGLSVALIEQGEIGKGIRGLAANYAATGFYFPSPKYMADDIGVVEAGALDCRLAKSVLGDMLTQRAFLLPIRKDYIFPLSITALWQALFNAYDKFSEMALHPRHKLINKSDISGLERVLEDREVKEAVLFHEYTVDTVRVARAMAKAAENAGSIILEKTRISGFEFAEGKSGSRTIISVKAKGADGSEIVLPCRFFVNACGAWVTEVAKMMGVSVKLRPTKGTTIIVDRKLVSTPLVLFNKKGEFLTIIDWGEKTAIGPTNLDVTGDVAENPALLQPAEEEISELITETNRFLKIKISEKDITEIKCGLRPQLYHKGVSPYGITHRFAIFDHARAGITNSFSVAGGKLSTQFKISQEVTEKVCERLKKNFYWRIPETMIEKDGAISFKNRVHTDKSLYDKKFAVILKDSKSVNSKIRWKSLAAKFAARLNLGRHLIKFIFSSFFKR